MIVINNLNYVLLRLGVLLLILIGIFIFVTLSIVIFAKKFNCEEKVFNGRIFSFLGNRKEFKEGIKPSITDGALIYTISLIALIYIGSFMQLYWGTIGLIATEVMILLIPVLYAIYIKADIKNTFSLRMIKIRYILGSIIVWFGGYLIINITTQILLSLFPEGADVLQAVNSSVMMDSFIASLVVVALIPAICEEVLFRGFLLSSFKGKSKKSKIWAIIIVGILFGIMHLNFIRIVPTAMLGILFAYSALATKSIWTSVFMHFLNNGFSVCVLYLNENYLHIPLDTPVNYTMPQLSSIIMTVLIGGAFIYLGSLCFKNKKDIIEA
ncbi:MAG: type II CAAX endopeptidase family protein [Clostridiales bacterium]|uniref:type II CAAX endopeptidase family protein n=1 Tax=Clostridium sp. 2218st1_F5_2218SCRN_220325 TaxID=3143056 RepID=UPI002904F4F5|nr:type II CAAX endopeptidase family protein [Clostridiales bacterium]